MLRLQPLLLVCCVGLIWRGAGASPPSDGANAQEERDYEALYLEAMRIRHNTASSWRQQQDAADLLAHAAGFRLLSPSRELFRLQNLGRVKGRHGPRTSPSTPLYGIPGVEIANDSHHTALTELAKVFRDGYGVEVNMQLSVALFRHAAELGDPAAQGQMGMRYSLGIQDPAVWDKNGIVTFAEPDEEAGLLNYYFAAMAGDNFARMVLGYRHMQGVGVPKSCWTAASYYQQVAEQVADLAVEPDTFPFIERIRLHVQTNHGHKTERQREVLQYYQYSADKGNVDAQTAVGQVLNYGTHGVQRDHAQALHYLQRAADAGDHEAMAHLGHMLANGFGAAQDVAAAAGWFQKAVLHDSASAQYGLGYMHLTGVGGLEEDHDKAFKLFTQAANQGHADANFCLGYMHQKGMRGRKNSHKAFHYFSMAAHSGHVLGMYNAALMQLAGKGTIKSCKPALTWLKQLAERGPIAAALQLGHEHFFRSDYSRALLHYLEAAEMGIELGQSNAAWMLHRTYVSPGGLRPNVTFSLIRRSAEQGNVASLLMMADSYLQGDGVEQDWVRSSAVYYDAYQERSAQAMFNLGFAHEFGMGVPKDLQLARRFYHMTEHTQRDASIAVRIACSWLTLHEAWDAAAPYVPEPLQAFWRRALTIEPPYTTVLGHWGASLQRAMPTHAFLQAEAALGRAAAVLRLPDLLGVLFSSDGDDDGGDDSDFASDTTLLVVLLLVLVLVMRARQQRAGARAAQPPQAGQAGAGAGGPANVPAPPPQAAAAGHAGAAGPGVQEEHN